MIEKVSLRLIAISVWHSYRRHFAFWIASSMQTVGKRKIRLEFRVAGSSRERNDVSNVAHPGYKLDGSFQS